MDHRHSRAPPRSAGGQTDSAVKMQLTKILRTLGQLDIARQRARNGRQVITETAYHYGCTHGLRMMLAQNEELEQALAWTLIGEREREMHLLDRKRKEGTPACRRELRDYLAVMTPQVDRTYGMRPTDDQRSVQELRAAKLALEQEMQAEEERLRSLELPELVRSQPPLAPRPLRTLEDLRRYPVYAMECNRAQAAELEQSIERQLSTLIDGCKGIEPLVRRQAIELAQVRDELAQVRGKLAKACGEAETLHRCSPAEVEALRRANCEAHERICAHAQSLASARASPEL